MSQGRGVVAKRGMRNYVVFPKKTTRNQIKEEEKKRRQVKYLSIQHLTE